MTSTAAPSVAQVRAALTALAVPPALVPAAALHLATGLDVLVGVNAAVEESMVRVRDCGVAATVEDGMDELTRWARAAVRVAELEHTSAERYLDLEGDRFAWSKVAVSGASRVLFGADLLYGVARLTVGAGVPASAVSTWLSGHRAMGALPGGWVASGAVGSAVSLTDSLNRATVVPTPPRQVSPLVLAEAVVAAAAGDVCAIEWGVRPYERLLPDGCEAVGWLRISTELVVEFPLKVSGGGGCPLPLAGVEPSDEPHPAGPELGEFEPIGAGLGGTVLVRHTLSGRVFTVRESPFGRYDADRRSEWMEKR